MWCCYCCNTWIGHEGSMNRTKRHPPGRCCVVLTASWWKLHAVWGTRDQKWWCYIRSNASWCCGSGTVSMLLRLASGFYSQLISLTSSLKVVCLNEVETSALPWFQFLSLCNGRLVFYKFGWFKLLLWVISDSCMKRG